MKAHNKLRCVTNFFTLQLTTGLVAGATNIGKYPEGEKALATLSKSGLFFLKWRAYANYKKELKGIRNAVGALGLVSGALLLIFGPSSEPSMYNALPGACIVLWFMLHFGVSFRSSVREQFSFVGLFLLGPWLILPFQLLGPNDVALLEAMVQPLEKLGIVVNSPYEAALLSSLVGGAMALFIACMTVLLFSAMPLTLLFLLAGTSRLSIVALRVSGKTAYNVAMLYFFVIGPILGFLVSKGHI
ncbi:hypothetical protein [Gilvimarinus xylanilyticus]|uniref:Uncharacterized protein n=1 Tax=Gilvimarinus xylanilyticus TaxID=2944139 RepID=A0A9X2HVJ7_9GAMM|nr:hypothetical protein [Gilvimarinus xylanilyticus]MCP8897819.1 hypothetical protein [Gilvimarinus xylanilyticus]